MDRLLTCYNDASHFRPARRGAVTDLPEALPMILKTDRLILRDFVAEDLAAMLAYWSDLRYQRFYPETTPAEVQARVRTLVQWFLDAQRAQPRRKFQLAITLP